jgi:serine/threonine protein kinase
VHVCRSVTAAFQPFVSAVRQCVPVVFPNLLINFKNLVMAIPGDESAIESIDNSGKQHAPKVKNQVRLYDGQRIRTGDMNLQNLEFLGRGGNGGVFRMIVREGSFKGLIVAVKFLEAVNDKDRVQRFEQEINILKTLNHPHIVSTYGTGKLDQGGAAFPFYIMEYQPRNLEQEIRSHPNGLPPDLIVPIGLQIASALVTLPLNSVSLN